jgi:PAS domain S-box-containing protein
LGWRKANSSRRKSLTPRLAALAVVPFVLLTSLLLLGLTYQFERLAETTIGGQQVELASSMSQDIEGKMRLVYDRLRASADHFGRQSSDAKIIQALLEQRDQLLLSFDEGVLVTDAQHRVVAGFGPVEQRLREHPDHAFPPPEANRIVSLPFESLSTPRHPAVAETVPILVRGQVWGYLSGALDLFGSRYLGNYFDRQLREGGYFSLTASDRTIILHGDPSRVLRFGGGVGANLAIDRGFAGFEGWMHTTTVAGLPMITAVKLMPSTGWLLAVNFPKRVAEMPFCRARRELFLALVLAAGALLALVLTVSRRLTRPLLDMTRQVEALTKGQRDVLPVPVKSHDELGLLSEAFNRLVRERSQAEGALRASVERHRLVVRNVPVVQWALDSDGQFTLAEGRGLAAFGFESDEIVGSNLVTLFRDNAPILKYFSQAKAGQVVSGSFEYGKAVFDSHWGPLRDESGNIVGVTAIALDVTEHPQAERARKDTEAQMGLLERLAATGRLAAGVAHEINNPLTYVISNLEEVRASLRTEPANEDLHRLVEEAIGGAERVAAIVRDLRVFARAPAKSENRCDPTKAAESAASLAWNQIRHRARLERDFHATPEAAISDGRLAQVLVNLLMNACLAIPEDRFHEHSIRVSVRYVEPWIVIEVTDNGAGMSLETQAHVFEPFFTTRAPGEGMGLGLALCHTIVTEAGGSITVQSEVAKGTTFRVQLPPATSPPGEATKELDCDSAADAPGRGRLRLLVIDDEPLIGRSLSRLLRELDIAFEVRARSALERLRGGEQFDAILCDLMMPEMSGMQFYEIVCQEMPDLGHKILFMSSGAFGGEGEAFVQRMGDRVFEKPGELRLVSKRLREVAEASRKTPDSSPRSGLSGGKPP